MFGVYSIALSVEKTHQVYYICIKILFYCHLNIDCLRRNRVADLLPQKKILLLSWQEGFPRLIEHICLFLYVCGELLKYFDACDKNIPITVIFSIFPSQD